MTIRVAPLCAVHGNSDRVIHCPASMACLIVESGVLRFRPSKAYQAAFSAQDPLPNDTDLENAHEGR